MGTNKTIVQQSLCCELPDWFQLLDVFGRKRKNKNRSSHQPLLVAFIACLSTKFKVTWITLPGNWNYLTFFPGTLESMMVGGIPV